MTSILIVNDDGAQSPMLPPMAEKLSGLGEVRIAVPETEQSWKGKAMTRFGKIHARSLPGMGVEAWALSGTPSDCVNIAVHHLLPEPPDWIVSGINIGVNAGTGFIINSGTVGAALEGALQSVPAAAFSTYLPPEWFGEWIEHRSLDQAGARRVVETTTTRMAAMMAKLIASGLPPETMVLNINFPGEVNGDTPVRWVPAQFCRYGNVFRPEGDGFVHASHVELYAEEDGDSDRSVMEAGAISVTPLSLKGLTVANMQEIPL